MQHDVECIETNDKTNIVAKIVERRKADIEERGFTFGMEIPKSRRRPIVPFMQKPGAILEVKRASPSKGDIAPHLDAVKTAISYKACGAAAISCLTEENYFKGSLADLLALAASPDLNGIALLRKDFLIDEKEVEIAYLCGADVVLLICGILSQEKILSMTAKCYELGISALVEVRTDEDVKKALLLKEKFPKTIVCGVNARNLKDFSIDRLAPLMMKNKLGGKVIFESGITSRRAASFAGETGFAGILLGEYAAKNPDKAKEYVEAFLGGGKYKTKNAEFWERYAKRLVSIHLPSGRHSTNAVVSMLRQCSATAGSTTVIKKICGITRCEDLLLADNIGADFVGFIFAPGFSRNVGSDGRFEKMLDALQSVHAFKIAVVTDLDSDEAKKAIYFVKGGILDCIQLHGISYDSVPEEILNLPHYFAITEKCGDPESEAKKLFEMGEVRFLQDSKSRNYQSQVPLWIAGGVTPENAVELCSQFKPELIDTSSGVEGGEVGIKDEVKLREILKIS